MRVNSVSILGIEFSASLDMAHSVSWQSSKFFYLAFPYLPPKEMELYRCIQIVYLSMYQ